VHVQARGALMGPNGREILPGSGQIEGADVDVEEEFLA
jgi:hypothetical protein